MPTRSRTVWKQRDDGQFDCRVGWKLNATGKREQHRFRLGADLKDAQRRDHLLRLMWHRIEEADGTGAVWSDETLELAKLAARGTVHFHLRRTLDEGVVPYVQRVNRLRRTFPMLAILPELEYGSAFGFQLLNTLEKAFTEAEVNLEARSAAEVAAFRRQFEAAPNKAPEQDTGPYLHAALREYIKWLESEYSNPDDGVTAWGRTQIRQVESLIDHHADEKLAKIDHAAVEQLITYWRKRPLRKGSKTQRVSKKSSTHYISALKSFFKWLHARPAFGWRKPENFDDLKTRVMALDAERHRQILPEQVFSLDELKLLLKYADPLDRLLILLGLNCGFGAAESASLLVGEVFIRTPHSERHKEMLGVELSPTDSFIKRIRRKSGVYGEFLLFAETTKSLEWALRERQKLGLVKPTDKLVVNTNGRHLDKATSGGNPNRQIPNRFARLLKRIREDNHEITALPFKMLRKTGGDLVKRFSDGEIAGIYLCHGQPVASDDLSDVYTTRPFGKLFAASHRVEEYLSPVFST
ncbi:hypothetical protein ETAA8_13580 [Anatilimnocola aggregata]|uniref:Core-binding (CB) domain-containing protein n=1 Tax=Anatilimnocola aggregata TaxID=2528021 RepID=A0A517Y7U8_9BACT|nr:hypothetical protein [Anatilimnocola aggregata]QDU26281.1 hypothetical protein ETAA8_13580 [Anatilimnocola aggregata]